MDFLSNIIELKKVRLARARALCGVEELRAAAFETRRGAEPHALRSALEREGINIIAEIKRASPSRGVIRADARPAEIARFYEAGGAAAISVLTEEDCFQGSLDDLREVRAAVSLPLLRKDFIFDEYQLFEAAVAGADALLLIVAVLDDETLSLLLRLTEDDLHMDALVEVHTADELHRASAAGAKLVGVNNRNLHTFEVSQDVSVQLARLMPTDALAVSESGLRTGDDLKRLHAIGYKGFLIGERLMRAENPAQALRALLEVEGKRL
jgi:indole-3-glycerol phosphate synthase